MAYGHALSVSLAEASDNILPDQVKDAIVLTPGKPSLRPPIRCADGSLRLGIALRATRGFPYAARGGLPEGRSGRRNGQIPASGGVEQRNWLGGDGAASPLSPTGGPWKGSNPSEGGEDQKTIQALQRPR